MTRVVYEKTVADGELTKIYYTSYLRTDFIERSVVVIMRKNLRIKSVFFTSYNYGSVEWINGEGLIEPRLWESDEQAVSPSYLTRRYTVRMSDGPASLSDATDKIIPDVLNEMDDRKMAEIIGKIVKKKKSSVKIEIP